MGVEEREMYASVSGSMMVKFDFDSSISPHSSSQEENCMSLCKSGLLFSPVKETANLSVDSLDLSDNDINLMVTCQANKNNYTIAFEGSTVMESEYHEREDNNEHLDNATADSNNTNHLDNSMTRSDSMYTTWSKLKQRSSDHLQLRRHPSGNNNTDAEQQTTDQEFNNSGTVKSRSLPNLCRHKQRSMLAFSMSSKLSSEMGSSIDSGSDCVKLYDIHNTTENDNKNRPHNFNLVKMFMKQKSSSSMEHSSNEWHNCSCDKKVMKNNWVRGVNDGSISGFEDSLVNRRAEQNRNKVIEMSQTSISESVEQISEPSKLMSESVEQITETFDSTNKLDGRNVNNNNSLLENGSNTESTENYRTASTSEKCVQTEKNTKIPMYILYPNYSLPNLQFLKQQHKIQNLDFSKIFLRPQTYKKSPTKNRPFSLNDIESLKKKGFKHVKDWDSLTFLLPKECKQFLKEIPSIVKFIKQENETKPLFCLSPPPMRRYKKCDCYDSNISATPSSGFRGSSTMLTSSKNEFPPVPERTTSMSPPRPPLPRGILRNSVDSTKNAKLQKENANKRYSMFELGCKEAERRGKSNLEKDMLKLEQLLEISTVFGDNYESFNENELKTQVSKFLTMQKHLDKVNETLENDCTNTYNIEKHGELFDSHSKSKIQQRSKEFCTPHNTPEHRMKESVCLECGGSNESCLCMNLDCSGDCKTDDCTCKDEMLRCLKKTVSFAEKICVLDKDRKKGLTPPNTPNVTSVCHPEKQVKTRIVDIPINEKPDNVRSRRLSSEYLAHKRDLIMDVKRAVEAIIKHYTSRRTTHRLEDELSFTNEISALCLQHLCPSLYAILSDGLKEQLDTQFGPIRNSVWSVVVASSYQGPITETLEALVQRLNRDDVLSEGLVKFNAFIFGLLNVKSVDSWFSYIRTRDSLLRKYYEASGLITLSNTGGASVRVLMDQLIDVLQPLSCFTFNIDLLYQAKLLHQSLLNINSLLEATSKDSTTLMSPTKQYMLLKLVKSIQNSVNQSTEEKKEKNIGEEIEKKTVDAPIREKKLVTRQRPRSGYEVGKNLSLIQDPASAMKKRWSGVQLNSKLTQAFGRLGEETDTEYTDSLDANPRSGRIPAPNTPDLQVMKRLQSSDDTCDDISLTFTKDSNTPEFGSPKHKSTEYKKTVLYNLNKRACDELKTDELEASLLNHLQNGGAKFRRLQKKWEMLSGKSESSSSSSTSPVSGNSPTHRSRIPSSITTPSPTSSKASKIPRPVTSPVRPTTSTFSVPPTRLTGTIKKVISPTIAPIQSTVPRQTRIQRSSRLDEKQITPRPSRVDENRVSEKAVRPSSLPYRGTSTLPVKKSVQSQARASSMSLNRRPLTSQPKINTHRTVRTLTHRLPSDSGHLTFNEGERLKVVLEVDDVWLLCCRGTQKGLVPRSAVITVPENSKF